MVVGEKCDVCELMGDYGIDLVEEFGEFLIEFWLVGVVYDDGSYCG